MMYAAPPAAMAALCVFSPIASAQTPAPDTNSPPSDTPPATPENPPKVIINADGFHYILGKNGQTRLDNPFLDYGHELTVHARTLTGNTVTQQYTATGDVHVHDQATTLDADTLFFDGPANQGQATKALLVRTPYTIHAQTLQLAPDQIIAQEAHFTTAPPDESPDFEVRASQITLDTLKHQGTARNISFYLFHNRLLTLTKYNFSLSSGGAAQKKVIRPDFGTSSRYGLFARFGGNVGLGVPFHYDVLLPSKHKVQAQLSTGQSLISRSISPFQPPPKPAPGDYLGALRAFSAETGNPLPDHDPLLFHDFLPTKNPIQLFNSETRSSLSLNEDLAYHVAASGRRRDDLFVDHSPEVSLNGTVALTPLPVQAQYGDGVAFRQGLRHPVVYLTGQVTDGDYHEDPTHIDANRVQYSTGLSLRPLLIAPNTVLQPSLSYTSNTYSNQKSYYSYTQATVALNHYYSEYSAVGIQYLNSLAHGDTPFNFDALDTTRELDARVQLGDRRFAVAGQARLDLVRGGLIDYKITLAPALHGFTPLITYSFQERALGFSVYVPL